MKNKDVKVKNNKPFCVFIVILSLLITLSAVLGGDFIQGVSDVSVGAASSKKYKAPKEMENTWKTEQNRLEAQKAAENVEPVLEKDNSVDEEVLKSLKTFFGETDKARDEYAVLQQNLVAQSQEIGDQTESNVASENLSPEETFKATAQIPIHLNEFQKNLLLTIGREEYVKFENEVMKSVKLILENGIEEVDTKALLSIKDEISNADLSSDKKDLAYEITTSYLKPNIVVNQEATVNAKKELSKDYDKEYYVEGQTIVDEGEIISEEDYYALDSLNLVNKDHNINYYIVLGSVLLILIVFSITIIYIYTFNTKDFVNIKEMLLLFVLYIGIIFVSWVIKPSSYIFNPILFFTILIALLFDPKLSIILNIGIVIIYQLIYNGTWEFTIYFLLAGTSISLITKYTTERNHIIISTFMTSLISFLVYMSISLISEKMVTEVILMNGIYAAIVGVFSVIIAIGTIPFWEAVFGVGTPFRLIDLSNPNSHLLRKLALEAPGTYHHSLIVANLAESAAYEIGANTNLVRAGGYYHDIGKLKYPQYFSENQVGKNPHDDMDPISSTEVIISHVTFGVELAEENKIPTVLKDIIEQHHGNTLVRYFYAKAKEKMSSEEIDENKFRYQNPQPKSKEAALVMLADTVEAAVRAIVPGDKTLEKVEIVIRKLVKEKLDDGQLIDSGMTIKDIELTIQAFLRVIKAMSHGRISYPDDNKTEE